MKSFYRVIIPTFIEHPVPTTATFKAALKAFGGLAGPLFKWRPFFSLHLSSLSISPTLFIPYLTKWSPASASLDPPLFNIHFYYLQTSFGLDFPPPGNFSRELPTAGGRCGGKMGDVGLTF